MRATRVRREARTGRSEVHPADVVVMAAVAVLVAGAFWLFAGIMAHHRGRVWLGMIAMCFALWTILGTVAVSALFHLE